MFRILYISDALSTHDVRLVSAISDGGHKVRHLPLFPPTYQFVMPKGVESSPPLAPDFNTHNLDVWDAARRRLIAIQLELNPDVVIAGPAPSAGFLAAWSGMRPLLVTLWGWDILVAPLDSPRVRRMVAYALRRADRILADCQTVKRRALELLRESSDEPAPPRSIAPSDARGAGRLDPTSRQRWSLKEPGTHGFATHAPPHNDFSALSASDLYSPAIEPDVCSDRDDELSPPDVDKRILVLPYGIELDRFGNASGGRALREKIGWRGKRILIHTRSFEPRYGVLEFIEAFARVASARDDVRAIVIGDGSLRTEVHAAIRRLELGSLVLMPGRIPEADLPSWYHAADIYVSAAHSDGTSISMLEAMAAGLPVVVSDAPGNREWVTPNDNGWLHRAGDVDDLAETLTLALAADTRLMSRANLAQVHRRADWSRNAQKLRDAVDHLVSR